MFTPPPLEKDSSSDKFKPFNDFPPSMEDFSPPPMGNFSPPPMGEFSPPPMEDFSPSTDFSPPPFEDFAMPVLEDDVEDEIYGSNDFMTGVDMEDDTGKLENILQLAPREILELKKASEKSTNFLVNQLKGENITREKDQNQEKIEHQESSKLSNDNITSGLKPSTENGIIENISEPLTDLRENNDIYQKIGNMKEEREIEKVAPKGENNSSESIAEEKIISRSIGEEKMGFEPTTEDQKVSRPIGEDEKVSELIREEEMVSEPIAEKENVFESRGEDEMISRQIGEKEMVYEPIGEDEVVSEPMREDVIVSEPIEGEDMVSEPKREEERVPRPVGEELMDSKPIETEEKVSPLVEKNEISLSLSDKTISQTNCEINESNEIQSLNISSQMNSLKTSVSDLHLSAEVDSLNDKNFDECSRITIDDENSSFEENLGNNNQVLSDNESNRSKTELTSVINPPNSDVEQPDFFADFDGGDPISEDSEGWGNFEETVAAPWGGVGLDEDADFGDFNDIVDDSNALRGRTENEIDKLVSKLNDEVDVRLNRIFCNSEDTDEKNEKIQEDEKDEEQVAEKESCHETENTFLNSNILLETVNKDRKVWLKMEDPSQTPALEFTWSESSLYSILLSTLNIDTRVMLNGESWKNSIPRNQKSGILQPTILQPSTVQPVVLLPTTSSQPSTELQPSPGLSDTTQSDNVKLEILLDQVVEKKSNPEENICLETKQNNLHSPDFDWSLPDGISNGVEHGIDDISAQSQIWEINSAGLGSVSGLTRGPENISLDPVRAPGSISVEAKKVLDSFPLLNFMSSTVLHPPSRFLKSSKKPVFK